MIVVVVHSGCDGVGRRVFSLCRVVEGFVPSNQG